MNRHVTQHYQDPVDVIWLHAAGQCGIQVTRDNEVFASWDGKGLLRIGTPETLDADDSLAQMILHELCHALVAGPDGIAKTDWGLDYEDPGHQKFERATLRLQAALAESYGLRQFFASTTDSREYYDQLPADPLADDGDPASELACLAMKQLKNGSWHQHLHEAFRRTREVARQVSDLVDDQSIWDMACAAKAK